MDFDWNRYAVGGAKRSNSFSGMQRRFSEALQRMFIDAPSHVRESLRVSSGYRSPERQAQLWSAAVDKYGSPSAARSWVAPPGRSYHNKGYAADLKYASPEAKTWVRNNAQSYGLSFPLSNEPWHIELTGARTGNIPPRNIPTATPQAESTTGIMSAINPAEAATPMARPMSLAEQYGLLDQARGMQRDIGLLRQDVAAQDPMGQLKRDLIARNKAYEMATAPAPGGILEALPEAPVTTVAAPQEVEVPTVTAYDQTQAANNPFGSVMSAQPTGGLLSPDEQAMVDAQQARLAEMGPNRGVQLGRAMKKGVGAFGGGLLGGMLLGPLGAVAGGLLGPTILNSVTQSPNFPAAPKSTPKGDGRLNDYGRQVQRESGQFDRAVKSGSVGLW